MGTIVNFSMINTSPNHIPASLPIGKQVNGMLENEMEWFAMFKTHVTEGLDTTPFDEMLDESKKLKAPTRILAALKILKDSFGWTDKQIFSNSRNDVKLRFALGLSQSFNIPSSYVFKAFENMLEAHRLETGKDIIKEAIVEISKTQAPVFKVGEKRLMLWATKVA